MKEKIFHDFETSFTKQNKALKWFCGALFICLIFFIANLASFRSFFIYKNSDVFRTDLHIAEICYSGFELLNSQYISDSYFGDALIKGIKASGFELGAIKIFPPYVFESENLCKIIIRDDVGLRAFEAEVKKSSRYDFGIKIVDIKEVHITQNLERFQ